MFDIETLDFNPNRVILLPAWERLQTVKDCLHLDDEFGTGIPAQRMVARTYLKERCCSTWNSPEIEDRILRPGDRLQPNCNSMDVVFLDGKRTGSVTFKTEEVLQVTEVGFDPLMKQFVFQSVGRKFLPVDWEMFTLINN